MANARADILGSTSGNYSTRMIVAYRYGSLALVAVGLGWALVFAAIGWWGVVALDIAIVISGLFIYMLIRRGHFSAGLLGGQAALMVIAIAMGLLLDVPTAEAPRVTHIYLLIVAALGYLNYQREKSRAQLALIFACLVAFIVMASAPISTAFVLDMPEAVRTMGTWANTIIATAILAGLVHSLQAEFVRKDRFSSDLMAALWNDEFRLVYQPQVNVQHGTIGAEALLRWTSPKRGEVPPGEFIPHAEKFGLMMGIGSWVLERGCRTLAEWGKNPEFSHLTLSINVSASQLLHHEFEVFVRQTLRATGANPERLILELTESVMVTEMDQVVARLKALHDLGITISLDDFGTGYSSLTYLQRLPIQQLKIDRSFVQDAASSPRSASLVENVVRIGRDLGHTVLAEGVETLEQHNLMARVGCVQFQGHFYGKPMPLSQFAARISAEAHGVVHFPLRSDG